MAIPKKLYAVNYKTGQEIIDLGHVKHYISLDLSEFISYDGYSDQTYERIPNNKLDPIIQKLVKKTGCMVFGDYVVGEQYVIEIVDEVVKHYAGEKNRLEELLMI